MTNKKRNKNADSNPAFDELFLQGKSDPPKFAALWFSQDGDLGMYFYGYENATKILLDWFSKSNGDNATVYPLIFLIRHTIEIGLKESIRRALILTGRTIDPEEKYHHKLKNLSETLEDLMKSYKISENNDWVNTREFINKLQDADPEATFGKYSMFKNGDPYSVKGNVYAGKIVEMGMNAIDTLDSLLAMLEEYLRMQSEYNREMGGEY